MHRNWLAITYELPISRWYFDATSKWTLDYPPFFAYFEWIMAQLAAVIDPKITTVANLEYEAPTCLLFQRFSVIVTDIVFCYGCYRAVKSLQKMSGSTFETASTLKAVFFLNYINIGLFLIDNVHFQYNSMMYGIMLLSIAYIFEVSGP